MATVKEDFQKCLDIILEIARNNNLSSIVVKSGELHRLAGGYPSQDHRMPVCCSVMRATMRESDGELPNSLKKDGATLQIRSTHLKTLQYVKNDARLTNAR